MPPYNPQQSDQLEFVSVQTRQKHAEPHPTYIWFQLFINILFYSCLIHLFSISLADHTHWKRKLGSYIYLCCICCGICNHFIIFNVKSTFINGKLNEKFNLLFSQYGLYIVNSFIQFFIHSFIYLILLHMKFIYCENFPNILPYILV